MARPTEVSPESAGAGAPASALELIGAGAPEGPTDPEAARAALETGAPEDDAGAGAPDLAPGARDRRRRAGDRRIRKGGHKATKQELERELKEMRAQLEASAPDQLALVQTQAGQLAPALGATFATAFGMLARRRGEHWKLKDDERQMLADHWSICLAPYMAQAGPYIPWAAAVMVTWGVVEGRVERDHQRALAPAA